jgi:hypothetical protein
MMGIGALSRANPACRWTLALAVRDPDAPAPAPLRSLPLHHLRRMFETRIIRSARGREYLRIGYERGYAEPNNLARFRERGLGRERAVVIREFGLASA